VRQVPDPQCLRAVRERAGKTRRQVAERAGVRKEYIYQVERGTWPCSSRVLHAYEELRP
jgi:transcriptional regulator with XRE-family HTH domain